MPKMLSRYFRFHMLILIISQILGSLGLTIRKMLEINFFKKKIKANICLLESPRKAINQEGCIVEPWYFRSLRTRNYPNRHKSRWSALSVPTAP